MIEVDAVEFTYPGLEGFVLGPVSLTIQPGQLLFWIGSNGSGKSTLARIIAGEIAPRSGRLRGAPFEAVYHHQSLADNVFPELRVGDHISILSDTGRVRLQKLEQYFPEISGLIGRYPDELSGGQLQYISFVFHMLQRRDLYIFDEVLNHLDPDRAMRVITCIKELLVAEEQACCIVISHDLELAAMMADTVHAFRDGRLVEAISASKIKGRAMLDRLINRSVIGGA